MSQTMTNEMAFLMARELLGIVQNCIRPEEHRDAFEEFFEVCRRGLNARERHADKIHERLNPSTN